MTTDSPFIQRRLTKTDFLHSFLVSLCSTILICIINYRNIQIAFARFDDIALIAAVYDPPISWFTQGFSQYFQVYPEFAIATTNFIRPVANLVFWLFSGFGTDQRLQLIATNYALHAVHTGSIFLFARWQSASIARALMICLSFLLTATYWYSQSLLYPAFAPDQIVLTFIMIALLAVYRDQLGLALIACCLAVLTKETALPILVAISIYGLYSRRLAYTVMGGLIIAGFFGLRYAVFSGATTGIYAFISFDDPRLYFLARSIASLPIGPPKSALLALGQSDVFATISRYYFYANTVIWALLLFAVLKPEMRIAMIRHLRICDANGRMILLIGAGFGASFAYFHLISTLDSLRFGYVAMWLLTILVAILHDQKLGRLAVFIMLGGNLTVLGWAFYQNERQADLRRFISDGSLALMSFVATRNDPVPIYLVNDFSTAYTRTTDVARLAHSQIDLQRGSSIDIENCKHEDWKRITTTIETIRPHHVRITSSYPDCAIIRFESSSTTKMKALSDGNRLVRNAEIQYEFYRDETPVPFDAPPGVRANRMVVTLENAKAIYFDFAAGVWRITD